MKVQINYHKKTKEIVAYSKSNKLNKGNIIIAKVLNITADDFEKIQLNEYKVYFKNGKVEPVLKEEFVKKEKIDKLTKKLEDKTISQEERDELLLTLLNK